MRREKVLSRVVRSPRAKHCLWEVRTLSEAYPRAPRISSHLADLGLLKVAHRDEDGKAAAGPPDLPATARPELGFS